jgi:hypothetical protein
VTGRHHYQGNGDGQEPPGLDLGRGVTARFVSWQGYDPVGLIETHHRPDGAACSASILFDLPGIAEAFPGRAVWTVPTLDPLTLSPSLRCPRCGNHGWITDGRWVPA